MRKTIAMLLLLVSASPIWAQNDKELLVEMDGGDTEVYQLPEVKRLDFSNSGITVVEQTDDGTTYSFDEINKITFRSYATGISRITTESQSDKKIFISRNGDQLAVEGWNPENYADLFIYATSGTCQLSIKRWNGQSVDISQLPQGIYVLSVGDKSGKFRK